MLKLKIYKFYLIDDKYLNIINKEKGFSAMLMVMILLILGLLLITSFSNIVLSWEKNYIKTHRYYRHYNQAQSAIEWARTQTWQEPTENWQCRSLTSYQLTTCIKQASLTSASNILVKGESNQIKLYHLATFRNGSITLKPGNWLDYCPLQRSDDCD